MSKSKPNAQCESSARSVSGWKIACKEMLLSGTPSFVRATSLPSGDSLPRRSLDTSILGTKSRRVSIDTRATDIDLTCLSSTNLARAERNGVILEVGRSVDVDEQRERLERNWNTGEQSSSNQDGCSTCTSPREGESVGVSPSRQRLERRWSAQHRQQEASDTRSSSTRALRSICRARRVRLKDRKLNRVQSVEHESFATPAASRTVTQEEADQDYLRKMSEQLHRRRADRAHQLTDRDTLGSLDSWSNVGLLTRISESELGRIVQAGLAVEKSLQSEEARVGRELSEAEQGACTGVSPETVKLRLDNKDAAHQLLVQYNLRLLAKIARKYRGRGMDIEDLIVEGARGLARAIEGYDPTKGNRFSTYAYNWISQSVGRCISEESRVVRLPMHVLEAVSKIKRAKNVLADRSDDPVTDKEVSLALGISEDKVALYSAAAAQPRSLDDPVKSSSMRADKEGDQTLADVIEDGQPLADDLLIQDDSRRLMKQDVDSVLEGLPLRERNILRCRYGLHTDAVSLTELSQAYGLTKERVRQIGEVALLKLQKRQASNGEDLQDGRKQRMPILQPKKYAPFL